MLAVTASNHGPLEFIGLKIIHSGLRQVACSTAANTGVHNSLYKKRRALAGRIAIRFRVMAR